MRTSATPFIVGTIVRDGRLVSLVSDGRTLPLVRGGDGEAPVLSVEDLLAASEAVDSLSVEELADLDTALSAAMADLGSQEPTDDTLAAMTTVRDRIVAIRERFSVVEAEAETRRAAAAELLASVAAEGGDGDDDGDGGETVVTETVTTETTTPAEEEAEPEASTPAANVSGTETAGDGPAVVPEPVLAAARRPVRLAAVARQAPAPRITTPAPPARRLAALTAAGTETGLAPGTVLDVDALSEAFANADRGFRDELPEGQVRRLTVATARLDAPEHRRLVDDPQENSRRMEAVTSLAAITAAGGICAPLEADYSLVNISVADRPLKAALPGFQARRGGIRFVPPARLADMAGGVGIWTEANDTTPASPTTKKVLSFVCDAETSVVVDAITRILKFGNFNARTFPEKIAELVTLADAYHARIAEQNILDKIAAASTAVTAGTDVAATADVLTTLDRAAAAYRYRHRMAADSPLRFIYPEWLEDVFRTDLARQLPGAPVNRYAVTNAQIAEWFTVRNINPTAHLDQETGTVPFAAQNQAGTAALLPWPLTVNTYLFHEGAFTFLDGGTLDLGIVRDSTLNGTNDFEMFMETFESVAYRGKESLKLIIGICPNGAVAGTKDTAALCTTGS